jgi:hypothetical protein
LPKKIPEPKPTSSADATASGVASAVRTTSAPSGAAIARAIRSVFPWWTDVYTIVHRMAWTRRARR